MKWAPAAVTAACAGVLCWQLLLPGFIGLANNGDFPKLTGRLCLGPERGGWSDDFLYFTTRYVKDSKYCWTPEVVSSAFLPAWIATRASLWSAHFDIRWLGTLYIAALLCGIHGLARASLPGGVIAAILFTDVAFAAYLNSFYMDAVAFVSLAVALGAAARLLSRGESSVWIAGFTLSAILFASAKAQHALVAPLVAALAFKFTSGRIAASILALVVVVAGWQVAHTPRTYSGQALFNLVFFKLTPAHADLDQLHLGEEYRPYVGTHAFMPGSPGDDPPFIERFTRDTSYARIFLHYMRHPGVPLAILWRDLKAEAHQIRPANLSNFPRAAGFPAGARTTRFGWWSALQAKLLLSWPLHMVVWLIAAIGAGFALRRNPFAMLLLVAATAAVAEFSIASLADGCETYRHLFIFHALFGYTLVFAAALLVSARGTSRT